MSQRLLRACQALEVAVTAAGSSVSSKPSPGSAGRVLRRVRHLCLLLSPPPSAPSVQVPATPSERTVTPELISEIKLVKPVKPRGVAKPGKVARPQLEDELVESQWDPDPVDDQLEASRSRALLLEIVRRTIYDWVLYRQHNRLELKEIAADAYTWLFEEEPGHPWWRQRIAEKRMLTSLHAICDVLDLEPETIRARARTMTIKTILSVGRPPETRHRRVQDDVDYREHAVVDTVDFNALDQDYSSSYYESYYSVSTSI